MANLGNTSTSALARSSASTANAFTALQDKQAAEEWKYSPQDQAAHDKYQSYIKGRLNTENSIGSISAQSSALSLQDLSMTTAKAYRSGQIQDATIKIQEGNYAPEQKAQLLHDLAVQAYNSGDPQSGQNIEQQYNSAVLSIQAKNEANQKAAAAGNSKAAAAYFKDQYTGPIKDLTSALKANEADFAKGKITQDTLQGLQMSLYGHIADINNKGSQDPSLTGEHKDTLQSNQSNLDTQTGGSYKILADPAVQQRIANGERIFTSTTDPLTGTKTLKVNQEAIDNMRQGVDAKGNIVNNVNANPKLDAHLKTVSGGGSATMQIETNHGTHEVKIVPDSNIIDGHAVMSKDFGHYIDPETNRTIDVALTGAQAGSHVLGQNRDAQGNNTEQNTFDKLYQDQKASDAAGAGGGNGTAIDGINSAINGGLQGLGVKNADVGKAQGAVGNILSKAMHLDGPGLLDALQHPDHQVKDPSNPNDWLAGVSHIFSNPMDALAQASSGIKSAAAQRQAKFDSLAALSAKQLQAAQSAYQAAAAQNNPNNNTGTFNPASNYAAAHLAPAPTTATANIAKLQTQAVAKNPNGSVNAPAAATQVVTGLGYGNF